MFKTACIIASAASISAMQLNAGKKDATKHHDGGMKVHHPKADEGFCWANGSEHEAHCEQTPVKGKKWCDKESNHTRCFWGPMPKHDEKRMPCIGNLDEAEDGDRKVIDEDFDHFDINKDGKLDATNKE